MIASNSFIKMSVWIRQEIFHVEPILNLRNQTNYITYKCMSKLLGLSCRTNSSFVKERLAVNLDEQSFLFIRLCMKTFK